MKINIPTYNLSFFQATHSYFESRLQSTITTFMSSLFLHKSIKLHDYLSQSPEPTVPANGAAAKAGLSGSEGSDVPSPEGDADTWGAGGGGIASLSFSCFDRVDAAGATVGSKILP